MISGRPTGWLTAAVLTGAVLLSVPGGGRSQDREAELRALIEANGKEIAALQERMQRLSHPPAAGAATPVELSPQTVHSLAADYLREHPGAGMPPGVQAGYADTSGFFIRSPPNPSYVNWQDESRIPFELRAHVRLNLDYISYTVMDHTNHMTGQLLPVSVGDYSQLMVKRAQIILEGVAFDPDLRFRVTIHGDTRGLPSALPNSKVIQSTGSFSPEGLPPTTFGSGATVDNAAKLAEGWVAYDFHGRPCPATGCPDSAAGQAVYSPTYTLVAGQRTVFYGLEEFLGNGNEQFVEYDMADLFFDANDDNAMMTAGFQMKTCQDRFFLDSVITNGSESLTPNSQMDRYPGFITGFWYDFGGSWNADRKAWDLFGNCISDIDYSCRPVVRLGASCNLVPMDRRSLYGDAEQARYFVTPGGPNGTRLINVLNGGDADANPAGGPLGAHAVDSFDASFANAFLAAKYHGFSVLNEWWLRDLSGFRSPPAGGNFIIYQDTLGTGGAAADALFPNHALIDYGMDLQAGYFLVPRKLEVVARWSWVRGDSGDVNGNGTFTTVTVPGVSTPVQVVHDAFRHFREADEYTVGVNYFFKRHQLKWQTDVGFYEGGNPANPGVSYPGFLAGADGILVRTQFSLLF